MDSAKQALIKEALLQGRNYKEIASQYRVSFTDIVRIAREIREPSPFDVFKMVVVGMTPKEIADVTHTEFAEVKRLYEESVTLFESVNRHSKALKELEGSELYKRMLAVIQRGEQREQTPSLVEGDTGSQKERKLLAKVTGMVCAKCGEPVTGNEKHCPNCGFTDKRTLGK